MSTKPEHALTFFEEMLTIIAEFPFPPGDNLEEFVNILSYIGLEDYDYNTYHKNYIASFSKLGDLVTKIGQSSLSTIKGLNNLLEEQSKKYNIPLLQVRRWDSSLQPMKKALQKLPNVSQGIGSLLYGRLSESDKRYIGLFVFFQLLLLERKYRVKTREKQRQKSETARRQAERRKEEWDRATEAIRGEFGSASFFGGFAKPKRPSRQPPVYRERPPQYKPNFFVRPRPSPHLNAAYGKGVERPPYRPAQPQRSSTSYRPTRPQRSPPPPPPPPPAPARQNQPTPQQLRQNRDFFRMLQIDPTTDEGKIKKAYHKAAMKYHPDKLVNLSQAQKKAKQDIFKKINSHYNEKKWKLN